MLAKFLFCYLLQHPFNQMLQKMKNTIVLVLLISAAAFCMKAQCQNVENKLNYEAFDLSNTGNPKEIGTGENEFSNLALETRIYSHFDLSANLPNSEAKKLDFKELTTLATIEIEKRADLNSVVSASLNAPEKMNNRIEMNTWSSNSAFNTDSYKSVAPQATTVFELQSLQSVSNEQLNIVVFGNRNSLMISPNLNQRSLNILVPIFMQGSIEISNLEGKLLKTIRFRGAEVAIDLDFPAGTYTVKALNQAGKTKGESGFSID